MATTTTRPDVSFDGARYELREGETVLDAFLRGGANLAFSCRRGSCQVCMLQTLDGDPGPEARAGLREDQRALGLFLACQARPRESIVAAKPDPSVATVRLELLERERLSASVVRLYFSPESNLSWRAGQFIGIEHPSGATRSYSIASVCEQDFRLELHVRELEGGLLSTWLCRELELGARVSMRGPGGACFYAPEQPERELLLIAGGTGLAPLLGVVRDALQNGHRGRISLLHGSRSLERLYLRDELLELARVHENFEYQAWLDADVEVDADQPLPPGVARGRVVDAAFAGRDRSGVTLYLAGPPELVYAARVQAVLAGVARADVHADPFEPATPTMPDDGAKLAEIDADPELWAALEHGPGLTAILRDFYEHALADPRLSPFFGGVTKQRLVEKQYEFLSEVFTGSRHYFGARPFNAHHWMIISDELFDYREAMFEAAVRRYGLDELLLRRWSAVHERFRRELVKTQRRGLVVDGVERLEQGYRVETLTIDGLCDGCHAEILEGQSARHHLLTGKLYCEACAARRE